MKIRKHICIAVCAGMMGLALYGCGNKEEVATKTDATGATEETTQATTEATTETTTEATTQATTEVTTEVTTEATTQATTETETTQAATTEAATTQAATTEATTQEEVNFDDEVIVVTPDDPSTGGSDEPYVVQVVPNCDKGGYDTIYSDGTIVWSPE